MKMTMMVSYNLYVIPLAASPRRARTLGGGALRHHWITISQRKPHASRSARVSAVRSQNIVNIIGLSHIHSLRARLS